MSRNKYDSSTGTLTQIGGWQGVDNALSDTSENPVQNKILKGVLDKTYKNDDTAETAIADGDYFPYYDVSASAKRKTLWSNIISKLKNVFATTTTVAPIETTNVASRAYTTGQQFILNGILYKATANISSGGTINIGSGGNATTATDVTSQISNLNNLYAKIKYFDSGSLYDINEAGLYYLTANVTNTPDTGGGVFIAASRGNNTISGLYISQYTGEIYRVVNDAGTGKNAFKYSLTPITVHFTSTTSSTGAIELPSGLRSLIFMNAKITNGGPGFVVRRDDSYLTVFDNNGDPKANASVEFDAYFMNNTSFNDVVTS